MTDLTFRDAITNAIRFWERGRLAYNVLLAIVVIALYFAGLPGSHAALTADTWLNFFLLAVLANAVFCTAYLIDLAVQFSGFRDRWLHSRWLLLVVGSLFAATIARFIVRGIFGMTGHG